MSYMREIPYLLTGHYVAIAMRPITFPATKAEIIEKVGGEPIRTSPTATPPSGSCWRRCPSTNFPAPRNFTARSTRADERRRQYP